MTDVKYDIKELLDRLEVKIDNINNKMDNHAQRIARMEGRVKMYSILFSSITTSIGIILTYILHLIP